MQTDNRAIRCVGWVSFQPLWVRSLLRFWYTSTNLDRDVGFRCAL